MPIWNTEITFGEYKTFVDRGTKKIFTVRVKDNQYFHLPASIDHI